MENKKDKKINEISVTGTGAPGHEGNSSEAYLTPHAFLSPDQQRNRATEYMVKYGYVIVDKEKNDEYLTNVGQKVKFNYSLPIVRKTLK